MQFSIIIPVYNGEATLGRCLDSILRQTFRDFQTVIVNDASTDGTLALAQAYTTVDDRFTVISADCGGPGGARNLGLSLTTGDYVVYMDADDYWVRSDLLEILADRVRNQSADVYMYQMAKVTENGTVLERYDKPPFVSADRVLPLGEVYLDLVRDGHTLAAAWNKCVRRKLLLEKGIMFREDVLGEDIDWVLQLFSYVETICLLNFRAYAYTQHQNVSRSTQRDAPNDLVTIVANWTQRVRDGGVAHTEAVSGVLAFEYGICMGKYHLLNRENRRFMADNTHLLDWGLDGKTQLIRRFCGLFGYHLTCRAVRLYLAARRIW